MPRRAEAKNLHIPSPIYDEKGCHFITFYPSKTLKPCHHAGRGHVFISHRQFMTEGPSFYDVLPFDTQTPMPCQAMEAMPLQPSPPSTPLDTLTTTPLITVNTSRVRTVSS